MRKVLLGLTALMLLVLVAALIFVWRLDVDQYRPQVEAGLADALGREVKIESLALSLLPLRLAANNIRIGEDPAFAKGDFLQAKALRLSVDLWSLFSERAIRVQAVSLVEPSVQLRQGSRGAWNVESLWAGRRAETSTDATGEPGKQAFKLSVDRLELVDGQLILQRAGDLARAYRALNIRASGLRLDRAFPLELSAELPGKGRLELNGELGTINPGEPLLSSLRAEVSIDSVELADSGWAGDVSQVSGTLDIKLSVHSEKGTLRSQGKVKAAELRLLGAEQASSAPIMVEFVSDYELIRRRGTLESGVLQAGDARIDLTGSFRQAQQTLSLALELSGKALPVDQLQALMPAFGVVLPEQSRLSGGEMDLDLSLRGALDALEIEGPVTLRNTRLDGFSLGAKLSALSALAGLPAPSDTRIEQASLGFRRGPEGMRFDPIEAVISELGTVTGSGQVDADDRIQMKLRVKVDQAVAEQAGSGAASGTSVGRFTSGAMRYASTRGLRVNVGGSLDSPELKVSSSALAGTVLSGLLATDDDEAEAGEDGQDSDQRSDREKVGSALLQLLSKPKKSERGDQGED